MIQLKDLADIHFAHPPDYGKLIVYEFPKEKLVYGPFQIEALINQNTYISQQLSLWNQMGSRVIRGNLLVIPIENSILYVSPLYLRAEQGQLPELQRVIAAYGDHVVMKETLAEALSALFEAGTAPAAPSATTGTPLAGPAADRAREALHHYNQAIERFEIWRLDWLRHGARRDAQAFGGYEPAIGRSLDACAFSKLHPQQKSWSLATPTWTENKIET